MGTASRSLPALFGALAIVAVGACGGVPVSRLYALHLRDAPEAGNWRASLPLHVKAGGGNLNGPDRRLADLARDTDAVHVGSASCHHGPPITSPVHLELRAFYTDDALQVEVRWEDPTRDTAPKRWRKFPEGWRLDAGDQDGIALLWSHGGGSFGCQEACHMSDFSLRKGELVDLRSMSLAGSDSWEEAWVWKASSGAHALTLGPGGFVTASGATYRSVNSAAAADPALRPEARRAGTFGPEDRPLRGADGLPLRPGADQAPAFLFAPADGGDLAAVGEHDGKRWRVVFTRRLAGGERRQDFRPGGAYRFGVAVFDATSTDHHLARDTQVLELVAPASPDPSPRRGRERGGTGEEPSGIL